MLLGNSPLGAVPLGSRRFFGTAYTQTLAGALTPAGAIVKQTARSVAGSLTPSGDVARGIGRPLASVLAATGDLVTLFIAGTGPVAALTTWVRNRVDRRHHRRFL